MGDSEQNGLGIYLGRFQPFSLKHGEVVKSILDNYPGLKLSVGLAGWTGDRDSNNFLWGPEAALVARMTLDDIGFTDVGVCIVELRPEWTLEESLMRSIVSNGNIHAFSGSEKTQAALDTLNLRGFPINVIRLPDDDITPPRSREIRDMLLNGRDGWRDMVSASAAEYLEQNWVRERLITCPEGELKRPWRLECEVNSNGQERK
jgi:hypothetical protein